MQEQRKRTRCTPRSGTRRRRRPFGRYRQRTTPVGRRADRDPRATHRAGHRRRYERRRGCTVGRGAAGGLQRDRSCVQPADDARVPAREGALPRHELRPFRDPGRNPVRADDRRTVHPERRILSRRPHRHLLLRGRTRLGRPRCPLRLRTSRPDRVGRRTLGGMERRPRTDLDRRPVPGSRTSTCRGPSAGAAAKSSTSTSWKEERYTSGQPRSAPYRCTQDSSIPSFARSRTSDGRSTTSR